MNPPTSRRPAARVSWRRAVFVLVALALAHPAVAQPAQLAITAPTDGTVVAPGDTVSITVASPAGATFTVVTLAGDGFIGLVPSPSGTLPAQFSVAVPASVALGPYSLSALGRSTTTDELLTATILIDVERPDLPTGLAARVPQVMLARQGQDSTISLLADFADGASLDATASSRVAYATSNGDIATVDEDGRITGVGAGAAEITATYATAEGSRRALVRVVVPAPPYALTPGTLDFGDQPVGSPATLPMTLTNSSGDTLSIVATAADGDFATTDTCVSSSPLAPDAACTISVTFTPTAAGARTGALRITDPEDDVVFRLSGNGVAGAPVTISGFTPASGPAGTSVTITGTGFDATAAQNAVSFHGTAATVTAATTTTIATTVPAGATTGTIAVTTPAGSATSAAAFEVTPPPPPTIASFSPAIGVAGTAVVITGTNFDPVPANDQTRFNNTASTPTAATAVTVTVPVPPNMGSGRITVTTAAGTAVSSSDFIVPPAPFGAADVAVSGRIPFATPTAVNVTVANKIGLFLFDGAAGQRVSLLGTNGLTGQVWGCDINVSILKPDGSVLAPATCMEQSGFIDVKTLPVTGTYTILVDPAGPATGGVTLTLYDVPADVGGTVQAGGSSVTATAAVPGQNGALTFSGTAGQRVSLLGTNGLTGQVFGCDVNVSVLKPDGSVFAPATCMEQYGFIDVKTLPATGTYTILVDPAGPANGSVTLTLYDVPADVSGTVEAGGSSVTATMAVPGQNGMLTFSGIAGRRVSLLGTNGLTGQVFGCDVNVSILKPDGSVLAPATCMEQYGFIDSLTLPTTGTYGIFIDPASWAIGNLTLRLHDVPADYSGTTAADGVARTVTLPTPGQNGRLTFAGTVGQRISLLGTAGMTGQILGCDVSVSILNPDATVLAGPTCMEGNGFVDTKTLPSTGTYVIVVNPADYAVGSVTLTLYDVPADATGTLSIGSSVPLSLGTPGQNGAVTFSGAAGQQATVRLTSSTLGWVTVRLLKPDGTQLTSTLNLWDSFNLPTQTLPVSGAYTIVVDPSGAGTGGITVSVTSP